KDKKLETDGEGSPSSSSHVEAPIKLECHISATSCMLPCLCHHHSPSFRSIDIKTSISDGHLSNPSNIVIFPDSSHSRNPQEQEDADKKHDISSISGSLLLPFRYVIAAWLLREKQVSLVIAHGQTKSISESSHADICKEVKEEEGDMKSLILKYMGIVMAGAGKSGTVPLKYSISCSMKKGTPKGHIIELPDKTFHEIEAFLVERAKYIDLGSVSYIELE
ncbi:hypothetical protein ADUPG1_010924, partial [Aduncisulcus paluster]